MKSKTIRRWSFIHTWTSLVCTVFLLMLALTGLPLIFHHEIEHLLGDAPEVREMPADTPRLNLAQLVEAAEKHRSDEVVQYFAVAQFQVEAKQRRCVIIYIHLADKARGTQVHHVFELAVSAFADDPAIGTNAVRHDDGICFGGVGEVRKFGHWLAFSAREGIR